MSCLCLDNGYIEGKELDNFFRHLLEKLRPDVSTSVHRVLLKRLLCWKYLYLLPPYQCLMAELLATRCMRQVWQQVQ